MYMSFVHDGVMAALAMQFAIWLRYAVSGVDHGILYLWQASAFYGVVSMAVFIAMGVHRSIWRYTSFDDLTKILRAVTVASVIFVPILFLITRLEEFPRSVLIIQWPLFVLLVSSSRIVTRILIGDNTTTSFRQNNANLVPILIAGSAEQSELFLRMAQSLGADGFPYRVVGIIGDDSSSVGHDIRGVRIFGDLNSVPLAFERATRTGQVAQKLVITDPEMGGRQVSKLLDVCDDLGLALARAPRLGDLQAGERISGLELRSVDLRDLLGRPQKVLDRNAMKALVWEKRVLITGAGGTIGAELTRQVAELDPCHLIVVENSEHNLYQIDLELHEKFRDLPRTALLGDVRDATQMSNILSRLKPQIVFHAAALKHVPIVEDNIAEGLLTNVIGTQNVVDASLANDVEAMVFISTDKAVNPTSVMGATKRIAELYCQAQDVRELPTRFVIVRFGNVLGSTGSVVPLFQRQLKQGGPLTVTHPEVTRYFMTTREAVELVLQAATLGTSDDAEHAADGHIYVLDMGKPVRIIDLATRMIQLAGLKPHEDIKIEFTGLRPGEKLHESLFHEQEKLVPTDTTGILLATPRVLTLSQLLPALRELEDAARARHETLLYDLIRALVPEFEGGRQAATAATKDHTRPLQPAVNPSPPVDRMDQ